MPELRLLTPGDETALDAFLARHAESSMFLRANARTAGLADRGQAMQATYVAAFEDYRVVGVAAHCWRRALGLDAAPANQGQPRRSLRTRPGAPRRTGRARLGELRCRHPADAELRSASRADVLLLHQRQSDWILLEGKTPVSYSAFNSVLPEIVQIGGVWTPPPLRGRGYGRSVVAGSLLATRKQNVRRAVLFADPFNPAAQKAYLSLGFRIVGDYGLVLLPH